MTRLNKRIAITGLLVAIIIGCFIYRRNQPVIPPTAASDSSILTKQPCALPCWYGFIPGTDSLESVKSTIDNNPLLGESDNPAEGASLGYYYIGRSYISGFGVSFRFKDNMLYSLKVSPNIRYSLQDILERYGSPAGVTVDYSTGSPELLADFVDINLYYPTSGLVVTFNVYMGKQGKSSFEIRPEAQGKEFYIYPASQTLERLVAYQFDEPLDLARGYIQIMFKTEWQGVYSSIIDPSPSVKPPVTPNIQPQHASATATP